MCLYHNTIFNLCWIIILLKRSRMITMSDCIVDSEKECWKTQQGKCQGSRKESRLIKTKV